MSIESEIVWRHKHTPGKLTLDPSNITVVTVDATFTCTARLRRKSDREIVGSLFTLAWATNVFVYQPTLAELTLVPPDSYVLHFLLERLTGPPDYRFEEEIDLMVKRARY